VEQSILSIVSPGLLGSWEHFPERLAAPIERDGDRARLESLAVLLRPFMLRRTKAMVAPELPPRTRVIEPVERSARERALYEVARQSALAERIAWASWRGRGTFRHCSAPRFAARRCSIEHAAGVLERRSDTPGQPFGALGRCNDASLHGGGR